jgi:hypothetical protein
MRRQRFLQSPPHSRSGVTLIETGISAVLLGIVFAACIPALVWIMRTQRASERRAAAILEASNLIEKLTLRPWNDLPPGELANVTLPSETAAAFPALDVAALVVEPVHPPDSRLVTVEISWSDAPGRKSRPVRLSGWVFRPQGGQP